MDAVLHDTPDHVACARSLGPLLAAAADEIERNRELLASIVSALIDNGMFSATASQMGSPRSFQKAHSPNNRPDNTPADPRDGRMSGLPFENFLMNGHNNLPTFCSIFGQTGCMYAV